jgi:hypothetical protein
MDQPIELKYLKPGHLFYSHNLKLTEPIVSKPNDGERMIIEEDDNFLLFVNNNDKDEKILTFSFGDFEFEFDYSEFVFDYSIKPPCRPSNSSQCSTPPVQRFTDTHESRHESRHDIIVNNIDQDKKYGGKRRKTNRRRRGTSKQKKNKSRRTRSRSSRH